MACSTCGIGKRKKHGRSHVGAYNMEKMGMEALEVGVGAIVGGIGTLEVIRMVPAATINSDIRDGGLFVVGLAIAVFTPEEYKAAGCAFGATMAGVAAMNAYMRHFATPGIGGNKNPALGARRQNPALRGNANPALGNKYPNTNAVQAVSMKIASGTL